MRDPERDALVESDFAAAGVTAPDWAADPIPTLEVWRRWREAEDKAMAHKRVLARAAGAQVADR